MSKNSTEKAQSSQQEATYALFGITVPKEESPLSNKKKTQPKKEVKKDKIEKRIKEEVEAVPETVSNVTSEPESDKKEVGEGFTANDNKIAQIDTKVDIVGEKVEEERHERKTYYFTHKQIIGISLMANEEFVGESELVRMAIDAYVSQDYIERAVKKDIKRLQILAIKALEKIEKKE